MSYKVGDVVVIRHDLSLGTVYDGCSVECCRMALGDMTKLSGKTATITWANGEGETARYKIRGSVWYWSNSMFEGLADDLNCEPISLDVSSFL